MRYAIALALLIAAVGCSGPSRKPAVPEADTLRAVVAGMPDVRYRAGIDREALMKEGIASFRREQAYREAQGQTGPLPPACFLAVSGGGDNGAFGAGLMKGWTAAGDRPEFKLVTGVSTGALIAPFAFLGPEYDDALERFYTTVAPKDILIGRWILAAVTNDAMADNSPLWKLVSEAVDRDLLDAVAREYEKGRLLLIATVDLDARHSVIWNMTRIATSDKPEALDLFRSIMIASAAIPGAFPPVMIDVEVDGVTYQEMHVDGGTMSQVFVYPPSLHVAEVESEHNQTRERRVYIIRNARLDPEWGEVERRTLSITGRAISSLIQSQGIGDLYRIYATTQRDGTDYNLAFIPPSFDAPHEEPFDTEYMRALFKVAYEAAKEGFEWQKTPPEF